MQFLKVDRKTKLQDLAQIVGARNVETLLHINGVNRVPYVGRAFIEACNKKVSEVTEDVPPARKVALLNSLTLDSDVFEMASLMSSYGWKLLSIANTLPGTMKIPESIRVPDSTDVIGNGQSVKSQIYLKAINGLQNPPHYIDPSIFNEYSTSKQAKILDSSGYNGGYQADPMQWFRVPWGEVTLYSSLSDERIEFPVYPETMSDNARANYTTMPDLLYQYEPWQIYQSSGPRTQTFSFDFHRDMWTGDHRDGKANELIRACMANCYPEYQGSAVYTSTVTLYVAGSALISGILTDVNVNWDGPIGLDGFYLHCRLDITITEVSPKPLNYTSVRRKPLIG